jgi:ABC-2 type transport system ATP-binding protein
MSDLAIRTSGLVKQFKDVLAVDGVNLTVNRGEIYGFLGLNGAGKSTTIRMLLGMIRPTRGGAEIFGQPVRADSAEWRRVGHLVESPTAYPELTVRENLELARKLQALDDSTAVDRVIDLLSLTEYCRRKARHLSSGNLQRLGLAMALLHEPELLILDEPANGLDPAGVVEIRELLRHLAHDKSVTVFMSSHILSEVNRLATRIGIIHHGKLIEELDSAELERHSQRRLEIGARNLELTEKALVSAGFIPQKVETSCGEPIIVLHERNAIEHPDEVAGILFTAGIYPTHLVVSQEDLEQHFIRLTSGEAL